VRDDPAPGYSPRKQNGFHRHGCARLAARDRASMTAVPTWLSASATTGRKIEASGGDCCRGCGPARGASRRTREARSPPGDRRAWCGLQGRTRPRGFPPATVAVAHTGTLAQQRVLASSFPCSGATTASKCRVRLLMVAEAIIGARASNQFGPSTSELRPRNHAAASQGVSGAGAVELDSSGVLICSASHCSGWPGGWMHDAR